ncbi:hypothetical protein [Ferrovibrio sp.]|uniref:hypothetical protein n=1 Tax=Ferrovibrio sp. TaxID=1917215 RepID=UPI0035AE6269
MLRHIGICLGFLVLLMGGGSAAYAGADKPGGPAANVDIEAVIKACSTNSQTTPPDHSTAGMINASNRNMDCLEQEILEHIHQVMRDPKQAEEQMRLRLARIRKEHTDLWRDFYDKNTSCLPCGTLTAVLPHGRHIGLLQDIYRGIVKWRQFEDF